MICIVSVDYLGQYIHFDNIDSSTLRTYYIFPSICVIFSFFHQHLIIFGLQFFPLLRQFYPWHFILFDEIIHGVICSISLSDHSLLAYKSIMHFYVLILYPAPSLSSLMSSSSFLVPTLRFSVYSTTSLNSDSFDSSFPIWIPSLFLSDCHGQDLQNYTE